MRAIARDNIAARSALVIVGHGSTINPDSSEPTLRHAAALRRRGLFAEVACCFWKEQPSLREVFLTIESEHVLVVPNFISEGYFTQTVIPREMGLSGPVTTLGSRIVRYCEPVGSHARMTQALLKRAASVAPDIAPAGTSLLIVAHGTGLNDNSARAAKDQARRIRETTAYGQVEVAFMEEPPLVAGWDSIAAYPHVVAVPFFISDGLHSYQDIPVLLGIRDEIGPAASQAEIFLQNPHHLRGKTLYYASAIGTDPEFADIIAEQALAAIPTEAGAACL